MMQENCTVIVLQNTIWERLISVEGVREARIEATVQKMITDECTFVSFIYLARYYEVILNIS